MKLINNNNNNMWRYLRNLRCGLRGVVDGLVIVAVNTHTWVVDPIVTFGACDPAFGGLTIQVLTIKALGVVVIVKYLITVITSIFENSLTFFAFLPHLFVPFFSKDRKLLLFFSFVSFFCRNQFIFMERGSEDRCFTPFSWHSFVLPNVWDWNDFYRTLKRKNWHQMFFSCRPTTRYVISFWIFAGATLVIWCCMRCRPMESLCVQCGVKYSIITPFSLALFMSCKLLVWDLCPSSRRSTGDSWAENPWISWTRYRIKAWSSIAFHKLQPMFHGVDSVEKLAAFFSWGIYA